MDGGCLGYAATRSVQDMNGWMEPAHPLVRLNLVRSVPFLPTEPSHRVVVSRLII